MTYLPERKRYEFAIVRDRLKACAGSIISKTLLIEHIPPVAHSAMRVPLIHNFVHDAFRDVVVDCLARYFDELEERRREVLEAIVEGTQSTYGMRVRLVRSAVERMTQRPRYTNLVEMLEQKVNPEMYAEIIRVVRKEYAGQYYN